MNSQKGIHKKGFTKRDSQKWIRKIGFAKMELKNGFTKMDSQKKNQSKLVN
jgi:hypothetical protein